MKLVLLNTIMYLSKLKKKNGGSKLGPPVKCSYKKYYLMSMEFFETISFVIKAQPYIATFTMPTSAMRINLRTTMGTSHLRSMDRHMCSFTCPFLYRNRNFESVYRFLI